MDQSGKKNAKAYLVELLGTVKCTVWAENEEDVRKELKESAEQDGLVIRDYEIVSIAEMDGEEAK